jgi:hypothetical protein
LATKEMAVASQKCTVSHLFFHYGIFLPKQYNCRPQPIPLLTVPQLKTKLKGCHFDTTGVTEAELLAALNTLTDHDFQDAFRNGRSTGNGVYARKETISGVMVTSKPKATCDQMAALVPEIMCGPLHNSLYGLLEFPR